ncbi:Uncharacterised protein [Staphylococcus aureus]|nr:Uncharacterised protein [Staphylococcus aureus]
MAYNQLANAVIFILILNTITRDSFSAGTDFLLNHYVLIQIEKVSVCIGCQTLILNKFTILNYL